MYCVKEMTSTEDDFKLIKRSIEDTTNSHNILKVNKIYRVTRRDEANEEKRDNLMLFHGTSADNAVGIVKHGFKPSIKGSLGPGVYLTASSFTAASFSQNKTILNMPK